MKVLLAACSLSERWLPTIDRANGHYPLGLAYLHAVLEAKGHEVRTLPLNDVPEAECLTRLRQESAAFAPEVIGFNIITDTRTSTFHAIEMLEKEIPGARLLAGGIHTSVMFRQILDKFPHVTAVLGEAEETLPELLAAFETGRALEEVAGIAYRASDGEIRKTAQRNLSKDLDALPFPRHDLFFHEGRTHAHLLSSRGCPFSCSFCVLDTNSQHKMRFRSAANVVDEIEFVLTRFPQVKTITFVDDQFFADNKRVIAVCEEIVRRGIRCRFMCQGRVRPISIEMVRALEEAGFTNITVGLESGSLEILERCHKGITPDDTIKAMELFARSKMHVRVLLIVGLPGETLETVMETASLCRQLQRIKYHMYTDQVQVLFVYPGTEVFELFKKARGYSDEFWLGDEDAPFYTVEHDLARLTHFKEILLTYLGAERIFSPLGLSAQKSLLTPMLRYAFRFDRPESRTLLRLVAVAVERLMGRGDLSFELERDRPFPPDGALDLFSLTPSGLVEGRFKLAWETVRQEEIALATVKHAYLHGEETLTALVNGEIVSYLEACHACGKAPEMAGFLEPGLLTARFGIGEEEFAATRDLMNKN